MLAKPLLNFAGVKAPMMPGDILDQSDQPIFAYTLSGAQNLLASELIRSRVISLNGGAAHTLTLPTADAIVKALIGSINKLSPPDNALYGTLPSQSVQTEWPPNSQPLQQGASYQQTFINNNSGTTTFAAPANSGVSILGTATLITVNWIDFLIRVLNSSPLVVLPVTTTNTTLTLTNVNQDLIANVTPGMSVFGTGIGAAAVVTAVNWDTRVITVSVASTATADNVAVTFTPTVTFQRLRTGTV